MLPSKRASLGIDNLGADEVSIDDQIYIDRVMREESVKDRIMQIVLRFPQLEHLLTGWSGPSPEAEKFYKTNN
jgi:hypothetical protein